MQRCKRIIANCEQMLGQTYQLHLLGGLLIYPALNTCKKMDDTRTKRSENDVKSGNISRFHVILRTSFENVIS